MEYLTYAPVLLGVASIAVYTSYGYVSDYFTPPLVLLLRQLHPPLTQSSYHTLIQLLKNTDAVFLNSSSHLHTNQFTHEETLRTHILQHGLLPEDPHFLTVLPVLRTAIHGMSLEIMATQSLEQLRQTTFDAKNALHMELLESLWELLMGPQQQREDHFENQVCEPRKSRSWSLIGFQGLDPTTDLRGMAMLGLFQLVNFARNPHSTHVLSVSQAPQDGPAVKFFPFACAGIQITQLVLTLAREQLLGFVAMTGETKERVHSTMSASSKVAKARTEMLLTQVCGEVMNRRGRHFLYAETMNGLNDVYAEIFIRLGEAWVLENPPDVMSFGPIFKKVEMEVRQALKGGADIFCRPFAEHNKNVSKIPEGSRLHRYDTDERDAAEEADKKYARSEGNRYIGDTDL